MNNVGAQVPDEQLPDSVHKYLVENFPEKPAAASSGRITGPTQVIRTSRNECCRRSALAPHDPLALRSTGGFPVHWADGETLLGRIDLTSGHAIAEYHLDTPMSGPHGLVADRDGNIWFTANFAGYIGKLDVATGKITEYKIAAKGPDALRPTHASV